MSQPDRAIEDVLERMSTRQRVDWPQAEASASSREQRAWMNELSQLDAMAQFFSNGPLPASAVDASAAAGEADATLPQSHAGKAATSGASWGNLRLLESMGAGAFGEVYRAWDTRLNRQVALKLLHRNDDDAVDSMLEEARLLARVEHAHVVRIHGAETHEGRSGIWMEFVEGTPLSRLAEERGSLRPQELIELGVALCDALEAVHAAGVVHQDVKLQNLMQRRNGELVLMDFGAGRRRRSTRDESAAISGTPRYLAPELLQGAPASPQSDLWSVGVVLFRLLSGSFPLDGKSVDEIFAALRAGQRRSLSEVAPKAPARLAAVIERALEFDPARRFASAAEMGRALRACAPRRRSRIWLLAAAIPVLGLALLARQSSRPTPLELDLHWTAIGEQERPLVAGDAISPQEQLRLRLSLNRDAHVYILNRDETGSTTLLHPARDVGDAALAGGREHLIPGSLDGKQLAWTLSAQAGLESFLVIASAEPLREFERELAGLAAVDLGAGVVVRPMPELAMSSLTRGVTGVREVAETPTAAASQDVFDLARQLASHEAQPSLQLSMFVLKNTGQ